MMLRTFKSDIEIIKERDPAARGILEIFLSFIKRFFKSDVS